jgi:hypothetical protein
MAVRIASALAAAMTAAGPSTAGHAYAATASWVNSTTATPIRAIIRLKV